MFVKTRKVSIEQVISYTNLKLNDWWEEVESSYGVKGSGIAKYLPETNEIVIMYEENGVKCIYVTTFFEEEAAEYTYNVWMEFYDVEQDKIK